MGVRVDKKKVAAQVATDLKKAVKKKVTDPQKSSKLNSMFDDDFFKSK